MWKQRLKKQPVLVSGTGLKLVLGTPPFKRNKPKAVLYKFAVPFPERSPFRLYYRAGGHPGQ